MGEKRYDVAILGTGIAGTILGAILARNGVRTILLEQGVHPRFAIGESTTAETTFLFRVLAARYRVPEIAHLSTFDRVRRRVATTCGVKRSFSFVFHRAGEPQRPEEIAQMSTLSPPLGPDMHLFRQDVDAYLLSVAVSYGATVRQRADVTDVTIDGDGVRLTTRQGGTVEAAYVIDAGGPKAPIAQRFGLRQDPPLMRTHSRSLYTHMQGVAPFDACVGPRSEHGAPSPFSQATLHHLFHGGWMWVIPFDNHPSSTNRLCSVGLNLDPRVHPPTGLHAEEEFRRFIVSYPALAMQFEKAVAIREWTSTDRLQFSSTRAVGDRFFLVPHAFAFVDPLFSSGLAIAMNAVNMLAWRLIEAKAEGSWGAERFLPVEAQMRQNFDYFDKLVSRSYVTFSDFELWNVWYKVWGLGVVLGSSGFLEALGSYAKRRDMASFDLCEVVPYCGNQASALPEYMALFEAAGQEVDAFAEGRQSSSAAASRIFDLIQVSGMWPKPWGALGPRTRNIGPFTLPNMLRLIAWIKREGPACIRDNYFIRFTLGDVLALAASDVGAELRQSGKSAATVARDYAVGYNHDWRRAT